MDRRQGGTSSGAGASRRVRLSRTAGRSGLSCSLLPPSRRLSPLSTHAHCPRPTEGRPSSAVQSGGGAPPRTHRLGTRCLVAQRRYEHSALTLPPPSPSLSASQLDTLRQKRSALRARGDEVRGWAGGGGSGGAALPTRALSGRDAAALAAATQRRRAGAYAVSSSSSSSEAEEEGGAGGSPAPTAAQATAKLFAKLGIKGHDSDTSWASSPERGRIRAVHGSGNGAASSPGEEDSGAASSQLAAELARAQATIAALQQELAAARAQADDATAALYDAEQRAAEAEVGGRWVRSLFWVADVPGR